MTKYLSPALFLCLIGSPALAAELPTRVTIQALTNLAIYPNIEIPASVVSMNDSKLSAEVNAVVKDIPVLVGETVKRGEVLIELDNRDYKLNLLRAQASIKGIISRLTLTKYQLKQAKTLFKQKAISDELLQQRQAEVNTLKAELNAQKVAVAMAKRDVEKCLITSPFDAIITERLAQVGELANIGTPLVRIVDASRIEVSVKLQPQDVKFLSNNKDFLFKSRESSYPVVLRQLTPVVDLVQRNQEARFQFVESRALPGTSGILFWKYSQPHIPANLILLRNKQYGTFINQNNKAHFLVLNGAREGKPSPISLPLDTAIIIDGRFSLQDGDTITVDE